MPGLVRSDCSAATASLIRSNSSSVWVHRLASRPSFHSWTCGDGAWPRAGPSFRRHWWSSPAQQCSFFLAFGSSASIWVPFPCPTWFGGCRQWFDEFGQDTAPHAGIGPVFGHNIRAKGVHGGPGCHDAIGAGRRRSYLRSPGAIRSAGASTSPFLTGGPGKPVPAAYFLPRSARCTSPAASHETKPGESHDSECIGRRFRNKIDTHKVAGSSKARRRSRTATETGEGHDN